MLALKTATIQFQEYMLSFVNVKLTMMNIISKCVYNYVYNFYLMNAIRSQYARDRHVYFVIKPY